MMKVIISILLFVAYIYPLPLSAKTTGLYVMSEAYHRDDGKDSYFKIKMVLVDRRGNKRERILDVYTKDYGDLTKTFMEFKKPADIEGTAFLSWENERGDDTQYLYLPALGRARRIVSSQKNLRFVNTDFTYEDMQRRRPDKDNHRILREDTYNGSSCYVVESIPKGDNSQYSKRVVWVDKTSYMVLKIDFYNKKGERSKEMRVEKKKLVQNIWTAMVTVMEYFKESHKTIMRVLDAKYNQGLEDNIFSLRHLEEN